MERWAAAHAGKSATTSALVLPSMSEPPAEAALAAAGLPAPHGPRQPSLAYVRAFLLAVCLAEVSWGAEHVGAGHKSETCGEVRQRALW